MKVVTKLRAAFALYITLLGVLLTYHVSTIQHVVATGHELTEISARIRATSTEQTTRIEQLGENAEKFSVTHDRGYLEKFDQLYAAYDTELHHLQALPLSHRERREITALATEWQALGTPTPRLAAFVRNTSARAAQDSLAQLKQALEILKLQTQRVGEASQAIMEAQLGHSAQAAREAERLSWIAAVGILLLSLLISALIARSISEPLNRLTEGTREVAEGQFDYRLNAKGSDEFAQVAHDFNTMTERLGELDQMKRDFVSKVSHDLKTPLTSMQETISAMLDGISGPLTEKQRTLLLLNQQSGQRLSTMLAKLLDLSRLESGIEPQLQVINGEELIRRAVDQVEPARDDRGLSIAVDLPEHPLLFEGDADRMLQLLDNLLENAIKFSPNNGTIGIEMHVIRTRPEHVSPSQWASMRARSAQSRVVHITVSDHGPGVPDDQKERIFERFYQTQGGRAVRGRGVGLGLTISREIVTSHGGSIWVTDNPGGGSIFNVVLPATVHATEHSRFAEPLPYSQTGRDI